MAITISLKTTTFDPTTYTDKQILDAITSGITITTMYNTTIMPVSNTKVKMIIVYA